MDLYNKYSNKFQLNDDQIMKYIEEQELKQAIQMSKKKFNKKNRKQKEVYNNQMLVAKLNSELDNKRVVDRHMEAAVMDSNKLYEAEKHIAAAQQMEVDKREGLFGNYPEMKVALNRNSDYLMRVRNLRKNEVIPDGFVAPKQKSEESNYSATR